MKGISKILLILFVFCLPLLARPVFAADYDLYVDEDADSGGDGSSDEPFQDIEDAIDEAGSGDEIYIKAGSYDGGFTIDSGIHLKGESESKVKIDGAIILEDGSSISNLTVSGGYASITVKENAKVAIDECTIKDFEKIGINILAGNGELSVKNANIYGGAGKGFYVEKGNRLELSSSKIHDNDEEGVDIRKNVDGYVTGNEIYENGESGIEVILGSADLVIKNNAIFGNGASGIATQYYETADKPGGIKIESNTIKDNGKFGIDCNLPKGGNPGADYWSKGLDVAKNSFSGNKKGRINSRCKLVEVDEGDGGEEYDEDGTAAQNDGGTTGEEGTSEPEEQQEETALLQREEERKQTEYLETQLDGILEDFDESRTVVTQALASIEGENAVWFWFWGADSKDLRSLKQSKSILEEKIIELDALIVEAEGNSSLARLQEKRETLQEDKEYVEKRITKEENRFSLYGFFREMAKRII